MKAHKVVFSVIVTLILLAAVYSCAEKPGNKNVGPGIEYYRHMQPSQTPYDIEKGIHKLTPRQAKTINSYKFTYDKSGRLMSVEYVRNNVLLGYSSMGFAAKITYEYSGNMQIKHHFDDKNTPIELAGVFKAVYTTNDKGIRTKLEFFGRYGQAVENKNKIHSFEWNVAEDGVVRETRYDLQNKETVLNPFCPFYELRFTYNDQGFVTRMANYRADTLYNCTAENCGEVGVSYFLFEPNEKGDVEKFSVFNVIGQTSNLYWGWSKRINTYDENGYVLETVFFDQDGEYLAGKRVPVMQFIYDEHGAVLETKNLDKNRQLYNNPENKVSRTLYKYDDQGRRTETLRFDKDGVPVYIKYDLTNCCCF